MAICGRMLEAQGFRLGSSLSQTGAVRTISCVWVNESVFRRYCWQHGLDDQPLYPDRRLRHDDAYTPDNVAGKRRIAPHWFIPNVVKRRGKMCRDPRRY